MIIFYIYDPSNRLIKADAGATTSTFDLNNTYDYDGNIITLMRYGSSNNLLDDFNYEYIDGTNKLSKVMGEEDQYTYDYNGNMTSDFLSLNHGMKYDHRNLLIEFYNTESINFTFWTRYYYDEAGNRIRKLTLINTGGGGIPDPPDWDDIENLPIYEGEGEGGWYIMNNEYYIRGVGGNELAIYNHEQLEQWNVYGTDNVGKITKEEEEEFNFYYLKDHLGSVRVVINEDNEVVNAQDYDMWGYIMENRTFNNDDEKYKFTGKERDIESSYDYFGARYYMSRIGRWGSVEPLMDKYLSYSPYNYSLLNPIRLLDFDGKKPTDGILLVFPDYKIRYKDIPIPFLGHAGVLLIDNETGKTVYYDFGRFYGHKKGFIRTNEELGKVSFDDEDMPTESSLDEVLKNISEEYGHKGDIEGIYIKSKEFEKMQEYAESERNKIIEGKEFEHYNIILNSCLHFSIKTIEADKNIDLPTAITPIPTEYIRIVRWLYDYEEVDYEAK